MAILERRGRFLVARPLFEPGPQVSLDRRDRGSAGRMALIEIGPARARIVRELGSPERPREVVEALLWERLDELGFSHATELEAAEAASRAGANPGKRRDLTELATFTVDPATARDFDDAVSARRVGDAVRLWIHIADVAAHVRPESGLERQAYQRANSVYVPGFVEPMLPGALSSGACSLAPGEERLAVTAELTLDAVGGVGATSFYRSRIRSDARLDYDQLDEIFAGKASAPAEVARPMEIARAIAASLAERQPSSALEIATAEPEFHFDGDGNVVRAHSVVGTEAHRLIERLMILCNEQIAGLLERKRLPTLFRVHEQPDPQRIEFLVEQLDALDIPTPPLPERISPGEAGELAAEASRLVTAEAGRRGHGLEAYTSLVLRAMKQAHYSDRNLGHAGLGSPAYCHFTSPIRRYPDLIAHRALLSAIGERQPAPRAEHVREAGGHCSERERDAARIEHQADDICAAFLLQRELFERGSQVEFQGEISGVIGGGAFVRFSGELGDSYEGFVPARRLGGERFELNETETAIVGTRTGLTLRLGDPISVRVDRVEAPRGRVDLEPAGADGDG